MIKYSRPTIILLLSMCLPVDTDGPSGCAGEYQKKKKHLKSAALGKNTKEQINTFNFTNESSRSVENIYLVHVKSEGVRKNISINHLSKKHLLFRFQFSG